MNNVRYSIRALARTPAFTAALVSSAAVGIGVNAVVFGFIGHLVDPAAMPGTDVAQWQSRMETIEWLLVTAALFVFVIAAASVAGLMLSRAVSRVHETSVRVVLGAHGRTLLRPLFAEGAVVAVASIASGVLAAFWTVNGLPAAFYAEDVEALPFVVDWLGVVIASLVGAFVVFGGALAPLIWTSQRRPAPDSRGTGPGLANTFGRWRSTLVVTQLTLCAVLLISTGAVVDHLRAALLTDHAERTGNLIVARLTRVGNVEPFLNVFRKSFEDVPVGLTHVLPAGHAGILRYRTAVESGDSDGFPLETNIIDSADLDVIGLTLVAGRPFDVRDKRASRATALVNVEAARLLGEQFPSVLGAVLVDPGEQKIEIVGLVRAAPFRTLQPEARPTIYLPYGRRLPHALALVIRLNRPSSRDAVTEVASALGDVDSRYGHVEAVTTLQSHLAQTSSPADRLITAVVQVFAGLALVLSLIGVVGVTTDAVARRTPEIALRLALGAPRWRIVGGVMTYG